MATLYKRNGIWWAWGYDRYGKRWRRTTKQREKTAARTVAAQIEQELALDADRPKDEACTLDAALSLAIEAAEISGDVEETIEWIYGKARHLIRLFGKELRCSRITLSDTTKYVHTRLGEGAKRLTVAHEIRVLVQALRRAVKLGKYRPTVDPSTLRPDELKGAYVPRERWLPPDEYQVLLAELDPKRTPHRRSEDRRDYVAVFCLTGVRDSELYRITPEHVDLEDGVLRVPGTKTEKSKGRPVPLAPVVEAILRRRIAAAKARHPEGSVAWRKEKLFPRWGGVVKDLYAATLRIEARLNPGWKQPHDVGERAEHRKKYGIPPPKKERVAPPIPFEPVTPNDFRRTFASWLAQAGVPLFTTAKMMGHGSTEMLEKVYARLAPQTLRDAIDQLPESVAKPPL